MLTIKDFKIVYTEDGGHYFSYRRAVYEICLEACANGYDVAVYKSGNLQKPKKCTDFKFKSDSINFGINGLKKGEANMVLLRALKFANEFYKLIN